jgi:hypothetical protein
MLTKSLTNITYVRMFYKDSAVKLRIRLAELVDAAEPSPWPSPTQHNRKPLETVCIR